VFKTFKTSRVGQPAPRAMRAGYPLLHLGEAVQGALQSGNRCRCGQVHVVHVNPNLHKQLNKLAGGLQA
jgi:hypothetical protein